MSISRRGLPWHGRRGAMLAALLAAAVAGALGKSSAAAPLRAPGQDTAYRLVATWRDVAGASRVTDGADGLIYVLAGDGSLVRQSGADGAVVRAQATFGLREIAADSSGDVFAVRDLSIVRLGPDGTDQWSDRIQGEFHPLVPGGERRPYLQALAWNPAAGVASLLYDKDEMIVRDYRAGGTSGAGPSLMFPTQVYWDIDYDASNAYFLNRAANSVELYADGRVQRSQALPAPAERIAAGPGGTLFFLSDRRWLYRIDLASGDVVDAWSATDPEPGGVKSTATDLTVDALGRVFVTDPARGQVRVYAPQPGEPSGSVPPPPLPGCQVVVDKTAAPTYLWLGQRTRVQLDLRGQCLDVAEKVDIVLVVDRSDSMSWEGGAKIEAARASVLSFLGMMDLARDQVALVTFGSDWRIDVPLTHDRATLEAAARAITPSGGTDVAGGLDQAYDALRGPARRADAKPILILLSDGVPFDTTRLRAVAAGDRLRYADIPISDSLPDPRVTLYTIGLGQDVDPDLLRVLARTPHHYFFAPEAADLEAVYRNLARRISASVLLKRTSVVDVVPGNMTYILDSAVPPAVWDPARRTLTWDLANVPFSGTSLHYWLQPQHVGEWPTNVRADHDGTDGLDQPQSGPFPVPHVVVVAPTVTPSPTALRSATPTPTVTRTHTPPPSATATVPASVTASATIAPSPTVTPSPSPSRTSVVPSATPDRHTIYVIIAFNAACFKRYADVALVIDASTTMLRSTSDGRRKIDEATDAARAFLDRLQLEPDLDGRHDQAAIVWYNDAAHVEQALTSDRGALEGALGRIAPAHGTRINLGLDKGHYELVKELQPNRILANTPVIVLLSDGIPNRTTDEAIIASADDAKRDGILVYAVGYGDDVREDLLRRVASQREHYVLAPNGEELARIYRSIAGEIVCR